MTLLHYLEETVQRFPNKEAIVDGNGSYSFEELYNNVVSIAGHITKKLNERTRSPILVYLPKGKECIAAFMGIVYSGNIYTPTDVRFPFHKVKGILDCLEPSLILSDAQNAEKLKENGVECERILLYEDTLGETVKFDKEKALLKTIDTDPVYVFFTSGSTGTPKGVTITHRSILDYIDWAVGCFSISEKEVIGNQAPFYFDNSILDVYLCLKTGALLNIIPENLFSFPVRLVKYLKEHGVNFLFWVPSALCHVANQNALEDLDASCIKKVLFCGEVMPNKQLNYWRRWIPHALFANLYGPTEITDVCTFFVVNRAFADDEPLPIGHPCNNTDILLLDEEDKLVTATDVQGEICVRGSSLSVGYWNSIETTEKKFCQNPLNPHYPERIYRTGDLAHYNSMGEILFDGRKDFQIKHMGYRIELGEIETAAASMVGIEAVCADYDVAKKVIVLFFVGDWEEKSMKRELLRLLPKYMVPLRYIRLKEFPYNDNGKIDRRKLREEHWEVVE